jgi:nucleoside-diphosphate-sugar epimerase
VRVLVTGAGGFIGRATTTALLDAGHEVFAVVRSASTAASSTAGAHDLKIIPANLGRAEEVEIALARARPQALVHLAWYTDPADYLGEPWSNIASLEHTLALLQRIRHTDCRRVVLGGSCLEHAFGSAVGDSAYAVAKRAAHAVAETLVASQVRVACAHIFWVYGPHEHPRRGVPSVVRSLLAGRTLDVTSGTQLREYLHVADVGTALRAVLDSDLIGRVDIATGRPISLRTLFEAIAWATGAPDLLRWGARPSRPEDLYEVRSDPDPLRSLGTWEPRYSLETGIAQTVSWWRDHLEVERRTRP